MASYYKTTILCVPDNYKDSLDKVKELCQKFTGTEYPANIRCGAYLLMDDSAEAQKCLDELSPETQKEFITFPICHFGKLIQGGKQ